MPLAGAPEQGGHSEGSSSSFLFPLLARLFFVPAGCEDRRPPVGVGGGEEVDPGLARFSALFQPFAPGLSGGCEGPARGQHPPSIAARDAAGSSVPLKLFDFALVSGRRFDLAFGPSAKAASERTSSWLLSDLPRDPSQDKPELTDPAERIAGKAARACRLFFLGGSAERALRIGVPSGHSAQRAL